MGNFLTLSSTRHTCNKRNSSFCFNFSRNRLRKNYLLHCIFTLDSETDLNEITASFKLFEWYLEIMYSKNQNDRYIKPLNNANSSQKYDAIYISSVLYITYVSARLKSFPMMEIGIIVFTPGEYKSYVKGTEKSEILTLKASDFYSCRNIFNITISNDTENMLSRLS